jgi:hypothetical protein
VADPDRIDDASYKLNVWNRIDGRRATSRRLIAVGVVFGPSGRSCLLGARFPAPQARYIKHSSDGCPVVHDMRWDA